MRADTSIILVWLGDLATELVHDAVDARDVADRIADAAGLEGPAFAREALSLTRIIAESVDSTRDFDLIAVPSSLEDGPTRDALVVMTALGLSVAAIKADWPSRPAARAARARVASAGEQAFAVASQMGATGADLYSWLSDVVGIAVRVVSDIAANAVPVVRVKTGMSLPSTLLAYQLYGDAARAEGLVDIARSGTPMLMPAAFDALAG